MRRVVHVGPYSAVGEPVTVHIGRLSSALKGAHIESTVVDTDPSANSANESIPAPGPGALLRTLWGMEPSIVHLHSVGIDLTSLLVVLLACLKHSLLVSIHDGHAGEKPKSPGWFDKLVMRAVFSRARTVIVHDTAARDRTSRLTWRGRIMMLPEYLPPADPPDIDRKDIADFRQSHQFLVAAEAPELAFHLGEDLYGAGVLIDAVHELHSKHGMDVGALFLLKKVGDEGRLKGLRDHVKELEMEDRFRFIEGKVRSPESVWRAADLFVRPTLVEREQDFLREVLSVGTPVVAGDCVRREPGVQLYKSGELTDLVRVLEVNLRELEQAKKRVSELPFRATPERYIKMYRSLGRDRTT